MAVTHACRLSLALCMIFALPNSTFGDEDEALRRCIRSLTDSDERVRIAAAREIGNWGKEAERAVPTLIHLFDGGDPAIDFLAAEALGKIGAPSVPELLDYLSIAHPRKHSYIVRILTDIGPQAAAAVKPLTELLRDEDETLRAEIVTAFAAIGDKSVVPILIERMKKDESSDVRLSAAGALCTFRSHCKPAIPVLIEFLRFARRAPAEAGDDKFPINGVNGMAFPLFVNPRGMTHRASAGLVAIGEPAIPAVTKLLNDPDRRLRVIGLNILREMGSQATSGTSDILNFLKDPDSGVREFAARTARAVGTSSKVAIRSLEQAADDTESPVRVNASTALLQVDPSNKKALAVIRDALDDADINVRQMAVFELGELGDAAAPALALLERQLDSSDVNLRHSVLVTFEKLGATARPAVPAIAKCLKDNNESVRRIAVRALGRVRDGSTAVPFLVSALRDSSAEVRSSAAFALGYHGVHAAGALKALTDSLEDSDRDVRIGAAWSRAQIVSKLLR